MHSSSLQCGNGTEVVLLNSPKYPRQAGFIIGGYVPSWSIYSQNDYSIEKINGSFLTHLNYAFARISSDGSGNVILGDKWADVGLDEDNVKGRVGNLEQLALLKQKTRIKTSLSIGGWTWSSQFSSMAMTRYGREVFVKSALELVRIHKLDGIDLDWEFPVDGGISPEFGDPSDANNLVLLLQEFRRQASNLFKQHADSFLLTIAVSCEPSKFKVLQVYEMSKYVDYFYLMGYDFHGGFSSVSGHHANLYGDKEDGEDLSVDQAVKWYLSQGVNPRQIVVGMPMYGRSFARCQRLGTRFSSVGSGVDEPGVYPYSVLMARYGNTRQLLKAATKRNCRLGRLGEKVAACLNGQPKFVEKKEHVNGNHQCNVERINNVSKYGKAKGLFRKKKYERIWDDTCKAEYIVDFDEKLLITYESTQSLRAKVQYIRDKGLGGVCFWELSADLPCDDPDSLLNAAKDAFGTDIYGKDKECLFPPDGVNSEDSATAELL